MFPSRRLLLAAILMSIVVLASAVPALAQGDPITIAFPAGTVCKFELQVAIYSGGHQNYREFYDKDGTTLRTLSTGTGTPLTFTNVATGASFSTLSNGANTLTTVNPDGTLTVTLTGHNVVFMFPTDNPPGPSTTLYVGQVVYTADSESNFTIVKESGKKTDICAGLTK